MIVTVTLNPAVDKTLIVHGFKTGVTNRAAVDRVEVGGKGINVARNLKQLGCDVTATGFLAADDDRTASMLAAHGISSDFVRVGGQARVNLKIVDPVTGVETEVNEPGSAVSSEAIVALEARLRALAVRASMMVFSGSLPPGVPADLYAGLVSFARAEGIPAILDTNGAALAHGIASRPDLVKPNLAEAEELLGITIADDSALVTAARSMLALGARHVVISLGPAGALGAGVAGMWRAHPPAVTARSTIGAGDAMVAALAYGVVHSLASPDALRLAVAASCAAIAATERYPSWNAIDAVVPHIRVETVPAAAIDVSQGTC